MKEMKRKKEEKKPKKEEKKRSKETEKEEMASKRGSKRKQLFGALLFLWVVRFAFIDHYNAIRINEYAFISL